MSSSTLFLLSGLLCDESVWDGVRVLLDGRAEIRPLAFPASTSISAMADKVLAEAPSGDFAVAGHSMGGRVALAIVERDPTRVSKLALLNTGVHGPRPGEAEKRQDLVDLAYAEGMAVLAAKWLPPMLAPERVHDRTLMDRLTRMVCRQTPDSFAGQIRALLDRPDAQSTLSRIGCPTLLLSGRQDAWSPLSQHEAMAALIPGSDLRAIDDSGHMSIVEQPAAVATALGHWLDA